MTSGELGWLESIVLGILQGLTEFFPVSSDGHLVLGRYFLDYHKNLLTFDVLLHVGTLGALLFVFGNSFKQLLRDTVRLLKNILVTKDLKQFFPNDPSLKQAAFVWWTTFVTGLVGITVEKFISQTYESLFITGLGFLVTSIFIFLAEYQPAAFVKTETRSYRFALLVGLAQAAALLPGVSRSGLTLSTCLMLGMPREEAGRYAFTVAIPIILLASLYEAKKLPLEAWSDPIAWTGVLVSFIVGVFALKGLQKVVKSAKLRPFAIYTFLLSLYCLWIAK